MTPRLTEAEFDELRHKFKDVLNYDAEDPLEPIDPLTYVAPDGDTCLHIAAHRGDVRAVQLLVRAGADVDRQGDMGSTPLHYASIPQVIEILLNSGASTTILNDFGNPPLARDDQA